MMIYIIILAIALLLGLLNPNRTNKKRVRYVFVIFFLMTIISALRKYTIGIDLHNQYYELFTRAQFLSWNEVGKTAYDVGYVVFNKLIGVFTANPQWLIAIHAIIVIGISGWFIYRNSDDVVLSTFMFITGNVWFMYMNIMRQSLAVCIGLIAIEIWKNKKCKQFYRYMLCIILYLVAISIHSSAFIIIVYPIIYIIKFRKNHIILSMGAILGSFLLYNQIFSLVSNLINSRRNYADYYSGSAAAGSAINIISIYWVVLFASIFFLGYFTLIYRSRQNYDVVNYRNTDVNLFKNDFLMYAVLILVMCRIMALRSNIIGRAAYYFIPFLWILLPRAIKFESSIRNRRIIRMFYYTLMGFAFIWLGYKSAAYLYGTVPYEFFWK